MKYFKISDIIEENNIITTPHSFKLNSLVEVAFPKSDFNGLRLFIVEHDRDCDGSPIYSLSFDKFIIKKIKDLESEKTPDLMLKYTNTLNKERLLGAISRGYSENSLKIISPPHNE